MTKKGLEPYDFQGHIDGTTFADATGHPASQCNYSLVSQPYPYVLVRRYKYPASQPTVQLYRGRFFRIPLLPALPYKVGFAKFMAPTFYAGYTGWYGVEVMATGFVDYGFSNEADPTLLFSGDGSLETEVRDLANDRLIKHLQENQASWANNALEAKETLGLVGNAARTIAQSLLNWKRRYPKDWRKVTSAHKHRATANERSNGRTLPRDHAIYGYPDGWLQWSYGVSPLLDDIDSTLKRVQDSGAEKLFPICRFRGSATMSTSTIDQLAGQYGRWGSGLEFIPGCNTPDGVLTDWRTIRSVKGRFSFVYRLSNPGMRDANELGLINAPSIIWDAVPYSFIVDQVLPIGNYLNALSADAGFEVVTGSYAQKTIVASVTTGGRVISQGFNTNSRVAVDGGSYRCNLFERTVLGATPVHPPRLRNPLTPFNIANDLALLVQAFRPGH